ncbi:hypothetical protein GGU11DRAFT_755312 [Lentinula aff. detonsa]|nr:hypothetical protein GGU11DRAFT_755312 [Lentinula aff. detonsa]
MSAAFPSSMPGPVVLVYKSSFIPHVDDLDDDGIFVPRGAENVIASDATEANVLNLVFGKTKIPVPRMRQWGNFFIVKHYIEGQLLADFWLTYTIWQKIGVAFTLRRYVRQAKQLRAILRR